MTTARVEPAPAKVNLTLRVLGRRPDGYHEIESLVVFAAVGDALSFAPGRELALAVRGPTASASGDTGENLVLRAVRALSERIDGIALGRFVTVTATPLGGVDDGSTSEFSNCVAVALPPPVNPFIVTIADDSGPGSLRNAIVAANANRLQAIAWALLTLQLLSIVIGAIGKAVSTPAHPVHLDAGFSIGGWLAVLLTFLLARVFAEGTLMRDDLEGTV